MGSAEEIAGFAALLRELKQRSGLSYEGLAKRAHMSTSTLHRYCRGDGVPADYAVVSRFARLCGATPDELVELHRRWVLADAARERARRVAADPAGEPAEAAGTSGAAPEPPSAQPKTPAAPPVLPEEQPAPAPSPGRRTVRRRWVLVAAAVAVVVAVATALTVDREGRDADPSAPGTATALAQDGAGVPLTVSTRTYGWDDPQCEGKYLIDRPPADVAPPVMGQYVPGWVKAHRAVAADEQRVALTVQGTGDETVVIESMHVGVVDASAPPAWNAYLGSSGCGGGVETRSFDTDLDAGNPVIKPKAGQRGFPYKVSRSDPEVLYITAHADTHDVKWYVDLEWNSGGRQGTIRISDHGTPFRTTGSRGRPVYEYLLGGTHWYRNAGG
ncbi:helix-turn-helix transcriptional regulator [Streptomyces sp. BV129]|uniref:helix-turn-helix domain-containing protein n=1 Tax=Streptomyces sp. BV129 TaxID=2849671 RepID=UPI001C2E6494|nr:helix-turn-helix transcriptional regulator [Streptomyces sp. BV129]MBV1949929.1 helix-turn-helix domain-containing protein [Streptomyces sp. BV129]